MLNKIKKFLRKLGPGLITGASDNDPAGISTYSVAGASTGYAFLWLSILSFPLMVAVQGISARIGAVHKQGLGDVIQKIYGRNWLTVAIIALVISNVATIGADLAGIAAGLSLLTGVGIHWFVVPAAAFIVIVEVFWSYRTFARYLKYMTLVLFAYVFAGILAKPDLLDALHGTFIPRISFDKNSLVVLVGMLGTTISPYMFFWQASEEVEEIESESSDSSTDRGGSSQAERERLIDTVTGMFYAVLIFYFIVLTSAATLNKEHITDINTAAQAAQALRPIAGDYAYLLFALGIVGAGLIAVPVLAGSTAYPIAEWLGKREGLDKSVHQAFWFYVILAASVAVGMAIALLPINPIDALFYSQVLMGLLTPVLLVLLMLISRSREIMGEENVNRPFFNIFGWLAVITIVFADAAMVWTLFK